MVRKSVVASFVLSLALVACTSPTTTQPKPTTVPAKATVASTKVAGTPVADATTKAETTKKADKIFAVVGSSFKFVVDGVTNPDLKVKVGDVVTIEFSSEQGFHDWVLDEFSARTQQTQAGGSTSVTFTASKAGTFEYYCSVGNHRGMGMKGNFIVE